MSAQKLHCVGRTSLASGADDTRRAQFPASGADPKGSEDAGLSPATVDIVLVEDNDDDARMTIMALKRIDPAPTVHIVYDGAEALELFTGEPTIRPKLIVLDLKLPKVSGLEVLSMLKSHPVMSAVPVMVLSSSDEPRDVRTAKSLGCADYVRKPLDWMQYMHDVSSAVSKLLNLASESSE